MNNDTLLRRDDHCRICKQRDTVSVLDLEPTPLEDQFVSRDQLQAEQKTYPLEVALCKNCGYVYLPHIISPQVSYQNYIYQTTVTLGLSAHYKAYAQTLAQTLKTPPGSLVVDIGSNDGAMLVALQEAGFEVQGVEPSTIQADLTNQAGLPTINGFFDFDACKRIINSKGQAYAVTASYVFANIDDIHEFLENVKILLRRDGIFVVQTGYHPEQMKRNMFDYIYHEHFSYFTLSNLDYLFRIHGLEIFDAEKTSFKGGSIVITAQLEGGNRRRTDRLNLIQAQEKNSNLKVAKYYQEFFGRITKIKEETTDLLKVLQTEGGDIVGYGASHSTTTFTYFFQCAPFIKYIVDDNPAKQGRFSPGHHIPVLSPSKIYEEAPKYVLILAWQHSDAILQKHVKFLEQGGCFIIPLPTLTVIGRNSYEKEKQ